MSIRTNFNEELKELDLLVIEFANDAEKALKDAVECLYHKDVKRAQQIVDGDVELDKKELEINEKAILLIAKQQPLATDLRRLIIALRISSDIERMADHAVNIAKAAMRLGENHPLTIHPEISKMAEIARDMVTLAMKAFENDDISLAKKLAEMDDEVDSMYNHFTKKMLTESASNPQNIQHIMQMTFSARFIERYADHCTNIGESIFYLVKGETYDLNN